MKSTLIPSEKRIVTKANKTDGIINYDIDNNYPNRVRDILDNSGMGSLCALKYGKFIYGRGFQDTNFAKAIVNLDGLTSDGLLDLIKEDLKEIGGHCIVVNFNSFLEPCNFYYQPISHVRFTTQDNKEYPNMYAVNPEYGHTSKVDKKLTKYFYRFNLNTEIIQKQIDECGGIEYYEGQLFYYSNKIGNYPKPIFDSELESMQTDSDSKDYKSRNIKTDFMASHIITIDPIEGGSTSPGSTAKEEKSKFVESIEEYQGAENAGKIIVVEKDSIGQTFDIKKIDQQQGDKKFEYAEGSSRNNIRQVFDIPAVLINEDVSSGFNVNLYNDAINIYNATTNKERLIIEETFRVLFQNHPTIKCTNFSILQTTVISKDDEGKRKEIIDLVKDAELSHSQKIQILVTEYDMDNEDAITLVTPTDNISKTIAQILGDQLTDFNKILSDEYLTRDEKLGIITEIYGVPMQKALICLPIKEPNIVNPSAPTAK